MIEGQKFKITVYLVAIFLIGCITGGFATSAFRGPPRSPMLGNMAGRQMDRMKEELTLSQEQVERIARLGAISAASAVPELPAPAMPSAVP